jgi:hypothetical protein
VIRRCVNPWLAVALVAVVATALAASTEAAYTRPTTKPPTPADLLLNSNDSKTLAVVVLNLTPYAMSNPHRYTQTDQTNTDRNTKKRFFFAPVGFPGSGIPGLDGSWVTDADNATCKVFKPTTPNRTLHPYAMAFSFNERAGTVQESYHTIRLENVWQDGCHEANKNYVDVGLFFSRIDPDKGMKAEVFREIVACFTFVLDTIGLVVEPENPLAWYDWFVATNELKNSSFEVANAKDDNTMQAYFAAYPWPDAGSPADTSNGSPGVITYCSSCGENETSDGVDAEWGQGTAGPFAGNIVVTTHLMRGNDTTTPQTGSIAFVTVWTWDFYYAAMTAKATSAMQHDPAGRRIHSALSRRDRKTNLAFVHLIGSLTPEQRSTFVATYNALRQRHTLKVEQKALLAGLAEALEKGHTSLKGVAVDVRNAHEQQKEGSHAPHKP